MSDLDKKESIISKRKSNTKMKNEIENRIGPQTGAIRRVANNPKPQTSNSELIKNRRVKSPERNSDKNKSLNKKENFSKENKNPNFRKYTKNREENEQKSKKSILPSNDFRNLSLNPTLEDIIDKKPLIRSNIIKGAYNDAEHYLDVQFRLLKEDFIQPLRININNLKNKSSQTTNIYNTTQFISRQAIKGTIGYLLQFKLKSKSIDLSHSQQFMNESLLVFSDDEFKTIFFGTVADRNNVNEGKIIVSLIDNQIPPQGIYQRTFVMVESDVFFLPYYNVLKKFQNMNIRNFPFEKHIIYGNTMVDPPKYLKDSIIHIHPYKFFVLNKYAWPSASDLKFDQAQYKAFQMALTSELCLIQGPPGTGKTIIGTKIMNVFLTNFHNLGLKAPILIVCYTNHALDQFLESILKYTKKLVRIGGGSKSEILAEYNLNIYKRNYSFNKDLYRKLKIKVDKLLSNINFIHLTIKRLSTQGIISLDSLQKITHDDTLRQFATNRLFLHWLDMDLINNPEYVEEIKSIPEEDLSHPNYLKLIRDINQKQIDYHDDSLYPFYPLNFAFTIEEKKVEIKNLLCKMKKFTSDDWKDKLKINIFKELETLYLLKKNRMIQLIDRIKQYNSRDNYNIDFIYHNLWDLYSEQRWRLYFSWLYKYKIRLEETARQWENYYFQASKELDELKVMEELHILKQVKVIGMTTTMAAKYSFLLNALKTKIVIVEEAAEIMEAHIIASLPEHCEHLILIGDHQQLRPKIATYNLGKEHNFDISLFERLILNNIDNSILKTQHRMRPEICSLIVPSIYKDLKNHDSVYKYDSILGMSSNVAFLAHDIPEKEMKNETSHINEFEADFLLQLCQYLILQGYSSDKITILTPYSGQVSILKEKSQKLSLINKVMITTVDNFQGEENDIILLSLVRSNPQSNVGFLKISNRICVALSRAQKGLYIIGNMKNLTHKGTIWIEIKQALFKLNAVNSFMLLKCQIHPGQITKVSTKEDFFKISQGGCTLKCNTLLKCGHYCKSVCHILNRQHNNIKCDEKCKSKNIRDRTSSTGDASKQVFTSSTRNAAGIFFRFKLWLNIISTSFFGKRIF